LAAGVVGALLFALHGSRPEAVVWAASRFDLLATLFMLASAIFFLRAQRKNRPALWVLSMACIALSILSKETGYATLIVLVLTWLRMCRPVSRCGRRMLWFGAIAAALFVYRWAVLGGIGGYVDSATGQAEVFSLSALHMFKVFGLRLWANLFIPINWSWDLSSTLSALVAVGVTGLLLLGRATIPRSRLVLSLAITIAMALPALSQLLIGMDLEKSRLLYAPSVGFALLVGFAAESVPSRIRVFAVSALLLFQAGALHPNLAIWRDVSFRAERTCLDVVETLPSITDRPIVVSGLPRSINGVYSFANSFPECVAMHSSQSPHQIKVIAEHKDLEPASTTIFIWDNDTLSLRKPE